MKKIVSFGDSFIFGLELANNSGGRAAWPGLIAAQLGLDYECRAVPGCGNKRILCEILDYLSNNTDDDVLVIVNWTWCARWDMLLNNTDQWLTIGPTCTQEKLSSDLADYSDTILTVYQNVFDRRPWSLVIDTLQNIALAVSILERANIPFIQTYMDYEMMMPSLNGSLLKFYGDCKDSAWPTVRTEKEFDSLPHWIQSEIQEGYSRTLNPKYFSFLQTLISPALKNFDNKNFLDWSRDQGYKITPAPALHPLEDAHKAAANFWRSEYAKYCK